MASMCGSTKSYPALNTGSYYRPGAYPYQVSGGNRELNVPAQIGNGLTLSRSLAATAGYSDAYAPTRLRSVAEIVSTCSPGERIKLANEERA